MGSIGEKTLPVVDKPRDRRDVPDRAAPRQTGSVTFRQFNCVVREIVCQGIFPDEPVFQLVACRIQKLNHADARQLHKRHTAAENYTRGSNVLLHVKFDRVAVVQRMSAEPDNDRPLFHIRTFQKGGSDVRNRTDCQNVQGRVRCIVL